MKKILFLIVLIFPIFIKASCDYSKLDEYNKLSSNIEYELKYNDKKYDLIISNVYEKLYVEYNDKVYSANSKNEINIKNIEEGEYINIKVYAPLEDCDAFVRTITTATKYHNQFYNSEECEEYKDTLTICKEEFLTYKPTIDLLNTNIKNYKNAYKEKEEKKEEIKQEPTILEGIKEFFINWGIQLLIGVIVSIITIIFFRTKFSKIKHGI